jgi:Tfp pilus assembly protein PilN
MKAINLLPPDSRGTHKTAATKAVAATEEPGGIGAFVVLGVLAACVVALAAYVLTTNSVKDRQAQLDAVTAQAQTTAQRAAALKPYADFQQMAETRIQTVKDLAASRFDWEQALRDIARAIPNNVTLTSLNGSISSNAGTGGSTVRSAIQSPAVELKGCTSGQKQVASLLSRLRAVDGVTRVTLTKSDKPDSQPAATASVPGTTTEEQTGCGAGQPPAFELVMFFENSQVPESVQDITVGTASSTPASTSGSTATSTPASGVTTPPAEPANTATPASTPQGGGSK